MKEVFQVRENIKSSDNQRKLFFSFGCDSLRIRSGRETVSVLHPSYVSALWKVIFPAISRKGYLPLHKALSGKQTGFWLLLGFLLVFFFFFEELFCQGIRKSSSLQSMSFTTLFFFPCPLSHLFLSITDFLVLSLNELLQKMTIQEIRLKSVVYQSSSSLNSYLWGNV